MVSLVLNYLAPINDLSYGIVGGNLLISMSKQVPVALFPINLNTNNKRFAQIAKLCIEDQARFEIQAPSLRLWHPHDLAQHVGKGIHAGYSIFETNKFTERELRNVGAQDIFFVCSEWFRQIAEDQLGTSSSTHVRVAPLGVDRQIFYEDNKANNSWTTFLNVGKWEYRKGHDVLIDAFNKAFEPKDRVRLWMSSHSIFLEPERNNGVDGNKEWEDSYKNTKMGSKISFVQRTPTQEGLARTMRLVDCGIFPSRSEGWNLPLLEMMSCGKHVMATNFSAHTEFCNKDNALLIEISKEEEAWDGIWFNGMGTWADVSTSDVMDQMVEQMRYIHGWKQNGSLGINNFGIETAKEFSWDRTANSILKVIGTQH